MSVSLLALQQRRPALYRALRRLWWLLRHRRRPPAEGEASVNAAQYLARLRDMTAEAPGQPSEPPVLFLLFGQDVDRLQAAIAAVRAQTQDGWQLRVLAPVEALSALAIDPPAISGHALPEEATAATALLQELTATAADWIALLSQGQQLAPQALARFRQHLAAAPGLQLWYCDAQAPGEAGLPVGRTIWDPVQLAARNTLGGFVLLRRELCRAPGWAGSGSGADPLHERLRTIAPQLKPDQVGHSPLILVRSDQDDAALAPRPTPPLHEPEGGLSVLVPTRDGLPHLAACVDSVLAAFDAIERPAELLIIDNGSCEPGTAGYFEALGAREAERVRVLRYDRPFNYAAINNWAAQQAEHELLLLLNDDIEARTTNWLPALLRQLQPGVGAVGARLLYPDGRIQHAGIAIGLGGVAGHPGRGLWPQDPALRRWDTGVPRQMSAVTGACLLTRKSLYFALEGLDAEHLAVAFNDVDYCLRLGRAGHRVVYTPEATLIHHESISRGADDDLAKQQRFAAEIAYMRRTWPEMIADDPYYSPHWSLKSADLSLRWPPQVRAERCRRGGAG